MPRRLISAAASVAESDGSDAGDVEPETGTAKALQGLAAQMKVLADGLVITQSAVAEAKASTTVLQQQLKYKVTPVDFNHRGNRVQHELNLGVIASLTEACTSIEVDQPVAAQDFIKKGISTLIHRNKLIRLADQSSAGWALIDEYVENDLASDEEDERKIRRAETAALAKRKRRFDAANNRGMRGGYGGGYANLANTNRRGQVYRVGYQPTRPVSYSPSEFLHWQFPQATVPTGNYQPAQAAAVGAHPVTPAQPRSLGPCYMCGGPHLRNGCPILRSQQYAAQAQITGQLNSKQ
jgi:hypothetical protein